jgi:phospholipase C
MSRTRAIGQGRGVTRRQALGAAAAGAGALALEGARAKADLVSQLKALTPTCGSLNDIKHVIFLIQENRSFDHYYGTYKGVRGFADPNALPGVFDQQGYPAPGFGGELLPFHIDTAKNGQCTHDITHSWGPQHLSWDNGAMDNFVRQHLAVDGADAGPLTMGYYKRQDLPLHYALADAFTLCDNYHCSVIGPSDPNHLMSISGTIDPDGTGGGPVVETFGVPARYQKFFQFTWTTMPEQLEARGISWKVYSLDNVSPLADPVFIYFKKYLTNAALARKALVPSFPASFMKDLNLGTLPEVSWIYTPFIETGHPPTPVAYDEAAISQIVQALLAHPNIWAKTALFITYDENGGFFDHVPPPVPDPGTPGEFLTVPTLPSAAQGIRGPVGLGFRVPMTIVSPFAKGGFVSSDTFDHTSMLRFLETRFGAEVPNLSAWRRSVTGDLTSAFNFAAVDTSKPNPALPKESLLNLQVLGSNCLAEAAAGILDDVGLSQLDSTIEAVEANYKPSPTQSLPTQEPGTPRAPSGPVACSRGLKLF